MLYRNGHLLLSSAPQQQYFNCPYQFSAYGGDNTAWEADVDNFTTEPGDILILSRLKKQHHAQDSMADSLQEIWP